MADWLQKTFGGDIELLTESRQQNTRTADFLWNGKLWDLKTVTTEKSADSAIRKGLKQIVSNPGGLILNYGDNTISLERLQRVMDDRMSFSSKQTVDIIVVSKWKIAKIVRYGKK